VGAGQWADEDAGTDVLRGRGEAVEGSPTVDSVDGAGGGWVSEMEGVGGFMSGREALDGDLAGGEGGLVTK
jgi:hypothetical protein